MSINPFDAVAAYNRSVGPLSAGIRPIGSAPGSDAIDGGTHFSNLVGDVIREGIESNYKAEEVAASALRGEASFVEVVEAISSAEHTLRTVTTVRDKIVSAYQEILRMPI